MDKNDFFNKTLSVLNMQKESGIEVDIVYVMYYDIKHICSFNEIKSFLNANGFHNVEKSGLSYQKRGGL